jgi:hypothetical protein
VTFAVKGLSMKKVFVFCTLIALTIVACANSQKFDDTDGGGTPEAGSSTCTPGQVICGGACSDPKKDPDNCGACGNACKQGELCSMGSCATSCAGGSTACGGGGDGGGGMRYCANLQSDNADCGACGNKCGPLDVCTQGKCANTCVFGQSKCGGDGGPSYCVNTQTDNANCGACDVVCAQGEVCSQGKCSATCAMTQTKCTVNNQTYCANLQSDNANCGMCGKQCGALEVCSNGACGSTCVMGQTKCTVNNQNYCANLQTDNANCGSCGTQCGVLEVCTGGMCTSQCTMGQTKCNVNNQNYCANLQTDNANCGMCGKQCGQLEVCVNGGCSSSCINGQTKCTVNNQTYCANLQTDNANCGNCGTQCTNSQSCQAGVCQNVSTYTYSQAFVGNQIPSAQCTAWQTFIAGLQSSYNGMTISGSNAPSYTCNDPMITSNMAAALKNVTAYTAVCNGHTWSNCNRYNDELWLDPPAQCSGANCPSPGVILRACIGNTNWGGVNTATCGAPSQTMTLTFF